MKKDIPDTIISGFTFIDDSTLINNFYDILRHEFEFDDLFMKIGVNPKIDSNPTEIAIVKEWIKDNYDESNLEIELLNQFEIFRYDSLEHQNYMPNYPRSKVL